MKGNPGADLEFCPDFAERVLETADRVLMRRRRNWRIAGASALCSAIAALIVWLNLSAAPQNPEQNPNLFAATGATVASRGSPDALSWLFPDAEPLARYAAEDTPDDSADAGALFADDD